jgi:hypothetical protein
MPTCTCTHTKLSKTLFFFGQILNPKTSFFLGRREYVSFKQILLYKNKKSKLYIRDRVAVLNDMIYEYGGNITKSHGSTGCPAKETSSHDDLRPQDGTSPHAWRILDMDFRSDRLLFFIKPNFAQV